MADAAVTIKELKEAFDLYDKDQSGSISSSELKNVLKQCNVELSDAEYTKLFNELDRNHDGIIKFNEFAKVVGSNSDLLKKKH